MKLVDVIIEETGAAPEEIMLLRHFNAIKDLLAMGGTVEDFTYIQPTGSKYDFLAEGKPPIHVVAAIVNDRVYGVYRVLGIEEEGTIYSLANDAHVRFDIERGKEDRPARRFKMERLSSAAEGAHISGWSGREIQPVVRSEHGLFHAIEVNVPERSRINVEGQDYSESELETAIRGKRLTFPTIVPTSSMVAVARQRRGQDVLRRLVLRNFKEQCALCDVVDPTLLRASHIVGWAEREDTRGNLSNVLCLCSFHDVLFENGYWSLDDDLHVIRRINIASVVIQLLLPDACNIRIPTGHPIDRSFVRHHRKKHGFECSN